MKWQAAPVLLSIGEAGVRNVSVHMHSSKVPGCPSLSWQRKVLVNLLTRHVCFSSILEGILF